MKKSVRRRRVVRPRRVPKSTQTLRRTVTATVKKALARAVENKHLAFPLTTEPTGQELLASAIVPANVFYPMNSMNQGTASNQRIGDTIVPKSMTVKAHFSINKASGGFQSIKVYVYVLSSRQYKSVPALDANLPAELLKLLDTWNNGSVGFSGDNYIALLPVNRDRFIVHKVLKFTLTKDNTTSSDGKSYRDLSIRIPVPSHLKYDSGSFYPQNYCPIVAVGYTYADGDAPDDPLHPNLQVDMASFMSYEDA